MVNEDDDQTVRAPPLAHGQGGVVAEVRVRHGDRSAPHADGRGLRRDAADVDVLNLDVLREDRQHRDSREALLARQGEILHGHVRDAQAVDGEESVGVRSQGDRGRMCGVGALDGQLRGVGVIDDQGRVPGEALHDRDDVVRARVVLRVEILDGVLELPRVVHLARQGVRTRRGRGHKEREDEGCDGKPCRDDARANIDGLHESPKRAKCVRACKLAKGCRPGQPRRRDTLSPRCELTTCAPSCED